MRREENFDRPATRMTGSISDPADALRQGIAAHQGGNIAAADAWYRRALALAPGHFDALHLLGVARMNQGRLADAARRIAAAIGVNRGFAPSHSNLGNCLRALGRREEARASYDRAIELNPGDVDLLINRGIILLELKRPREALANYDKAIEIKPSDADAISNRAAVLSHLARWHEALVDCRRALTLEPRHVEALNNCGNALNDLGRIEPALASYDRALAIDAGYVEALNNRAAVLRNLRRPSGSLTSSRRAIALEPSHAKALNNRATTLKQTGDFDAALTIYGRALAVDPAFGDALNNRASALTAFKRYDEAIVDLDALLAVDPDAPYAAGNRLHYQMHICDWHDLEERVATLSAAVKARRPACTPFALFSITESIGDQLSCSEAFCRKYVGVSKQVGGRHGRDPIRVAYLSADFGEHPISYLLAGLFEHHDRTRFETIALSFGSPETGAMRKRLEPAFDRFIDVHDRSDQEMADLIRSLGVDIAVDLMGHTVNNRLGVFAHRPAPVSVNFFCPTGAEFIDYMIADRIVVPAEHHRFYRERIASLPDSFLATDRARPIAERTPARHDLGLPDDAFVFCCFNNTYKINPTMFDIWMRLLGRVPQSVLWLQDVNPTATANLRREAARRGIDPARLMFAPRVASMADHLARYRQADLFLDTLPFNAHTTAADALWAGLPVLTCQGPTFVGRVAASLLSAIGLPELAADSLPAYEALALSLSQDRSALSAIRATLARNRDTHPLFDTSRYCRHVESAYVAMLARSQTGQPPESFTVPRPQD